MEPSRTRAVFCLKREGRLVCSLCDVLLPSSNEKAIKQHLKSITHKRASAAAMAATALATAATVASPASEVMAVDAAAGKEELGSSAALELCTELGLTLPAGAAAIACYAEYASNCAAWRTLYRASGLTSSCWLLPPPVLRNPKRECPQLDRPFVTTQCGSLPLYPDALDEVLGAYFTARHDAHPKVSTATRQAKTPFCQLFSPALVSRGHSTAARRLRGARAMQLAHSEEKTRL